MVVTRAVRKAAGRRRRFTGLLPERLLRHRRPRWWQEIAILAFGYWIYTLGRNGIPRHPTIAFRHARAINGLQDRLHIGWEMRFNRSVAAHEWLAQSFDYYYSTLHFLLTPAVMIWLFLRHPAVFRGARTVLVSITLIALLGFYLYPTAPPRLLPGYVDTVIKFHTWGSFADPNIAEHSNQFAAMPSLHVGWALWVGIAVFRCAPRRWWRWLGLAYPVGTVVVIIGTANHFVLDAVGGAAVAAVAFGVQHLMSGHGAFTAAQDAVPVAGSAACE
jgi:PAP2 superfamily